MPVTIDKILGEPLLHSHKTSDISDLPTIPSSHTQLTDIGTNTHAQIDAHISNTNNPHNTSWGQITGTLSNQTDLQTALDGKANSSHNHDERYYTETELNTSGGGGAVHWNNITNKPSTYTPSSHTHNDTDITSFTTLDGRYLKLDQSTPQTITASPIISSLTASKVVFTDGSKRLTSTGIGTSSQFIKADGSLDSSTYLTAESDTLATVTERGATTSTVSTFSSGIKTPKIYPQSDSTTAIQITKADGTTNILNIDTTNQRVGIGTTNPTGRLDIVGNTDITQLIVRAVSNQTLNIIEIKDSSNNNLIRVSNQGAMYVNDMNVSTSIGFSNKRTAIFDTGSSSNIGVIVKARASQSSNLLEFQDSSGNILSYFDNSGNLGLNNKNIILSTTTGTKIGTATNQKLGFYNATPIIQPTTSISGASFVAGSGTTVNDASTFDGYTIGQVVKALRNLGLLA